MIKSHLERGRLSLVQAVGQRLSGTEVNDHCVLDGLGHHLVAQPKSWICNCCMAKEHVL
jgi:hypothetical protein